MYITNNKEEYMILSKKHSAFSLIELMIVVAIIIILAVVSIAGYKKIQYNNNVRQAEVERKAILVQIDRYYNQNGHPPQSDSEFKDFLDNKNYFPKPPVNPFYPNPPEDGWIYYYDSSSGIVLVFPKYPGK
jgi:type II secretory pathway pseudopilin PulG